MFHICPMMLVFMFTYFTHSYTVSKRTLRMCTGNLNPNICHSNICVLDYFLIASGLEYQSTVFYFMKVLISLDKSRYVSINTGCLHDEISQFG